MTILFTPQLETTRVRMICVNTVAWSFFSGGWIASFMDAYHSRFRPVVKARMVYPLLYFDRFAVYLGSPMIYGGRSRRFLKHNCPTFWYNRLSWMRHSRYLGRP